jgi:hypothetical protein
MEKAETLLDTVFGAGFKVGFLFVVVGMMLMYVPLITDVVTPTLDFVGFWRMFQQFPPLVKMVITGILLMGAAVIVATLYSFVEDFINLLLGKDPGRN